MSVRPKAIIYFEAIIWATLLIGLIRSAIDWDQLVAAAAVSQPHPVAFVLIVQSFVFALMAALTLLISRRRNKFAMWASIAMFILGIPIVIDRARSGQLLGSGLVTTIQSIAQAIAYGLLFTPDARRWMNGKRAAKGEDKDAID